MRNSLKFLLPALAASVLLAACGSSSSSSSVASPARPAAATPPSGSSALVKTAVNAKLGSTVLVDAQGLTLYHLSAEHGGRFICTTAACVSIWHPLATTSSAAPAGAVGSLGTVKRPNGVLQVTYHGQPLYSFAQDVVPGQANGQGVKDVGTWTAVTTGPSTTPTAAPAPAPAAPSGGGGGGGGGGY